MIKSRRRGYTLIEVLVALTMFAFITLATSFALGAALRGNAKLQSSADEMQEIRSIMAILTRDIRAAYAVTGNVNHLFTSGGSDSTTILQFSAMSHRISSPPTNADGSSNQADLNPFPQADVSILSYNFDPQTNVLSRIETNVPNADLIQQSNGLPETVLSNRVQNIQFQYYDPTQTSYRGDWNYTNSASSSTGASSTASSGTTGDTTLPPSVQVAIDLISKDGQPIHYETTIALATFNPAPAGQKPPAPAAPGVGAGGTGTGGTGTGGTGTGGAGSGGTKLGPIPGLPGLGGQP